MAGARMVCMTDEMPQIDALDARLLLALDADPFATVVALAQRLGVARNTVQTRLRRLDASGALAEVTRRVTPEALGFSLTAFLTVSIRQGQHDEALAGLRAVPQIIEIHATTGDADLRVRVVARDTTDLYQVTNRIVDAPGVLRTSTSISLQEIMPLRLAGLLEEAALG